MDNDASSMQVFPSIVGYLLMAFALWKMSVRKGDKNAWLAWIPIVNAFQLLKLAAKPMWWFILLLIPLVNIVVVVMVFMGLCEQFGRNKWLGLLGIVPLANIILLFVLAFGDRPAMPPAAPTMPIQPPPSAPPAM